jgi:hypothetical protein
VLGSGTTATSKFLSADLTQADTVNKSGYTVTLAPAGTGVATGGSTGITPCVTVATVYPGFDAAAAPVTPGSTGVRYFGTTEGGTVYQDTTAAVTFVATTRAPTSTTSTPIQ